MIDDPLNRLKVKRGFDLPQAKLNDTLVKEIRATAKLREEVRKLLSQYSNENIAKEYNVHPNTVDKLIQGYTWSHVK